MRFLLSTVVNGLLLLSVQVIALVSLTPVEFGSFSIQYLVFAFAASVMLSIVSEAWTRSDLGGRGRSSWHQYSAVSLQLATVAGLLTLGLSLAVGALQTVAVPGAIAVAAGAYRSSVRYFRVRSGAPVLLGDLAGLLVTIGVWSLTSVLGGSGLPLVVMSWAGGALTSAVVQSQRPRLLPPRVFLVWWRRHRESIRPLLRDSLLMDSGAIGTPYVIAPLLGLAEFGIYRAVSNVAAPVRLLMSPLRPVLMSVPLVMQRSIRWIAGSTLSSLAFGALAYAALELISVISIGAGVLNDLVVFSIPVGIYVAFNTLGTYYMIVARGHIDAGWLLLGRVLHTVIAIVVPIAGALIGGLSGAIWAYAICTVTWSMVWVVVVFKRIS
jgi:hypothetical protein